MITFPRLLFGLVILALLLSGCGRGQGVPRAAVSGDVLLDGKPVEYASVQFIPIPPTQGPRATAQVTDGQFDLSSYCGPVYGNLRVEIRTDFGRMYPGEGPEQLAKRFHGPPPEPIPPQYNQDSILKVTTVPARDNKFSFRLRTKAQKPNSENP